MHNKPNVLFLADTTHPASAVSDNIHAIISGKHIAWHIVNPLIDKTIDKLDMTLFDAVGIHYSIKPYGTYYLSKALQNKIAEYTGIKFLFLQDEYQRVNDVQDFLFNLGFNLLFTLVNTKFLETAYPDKRLAQLKKIPIITAYVTDEMKHWHSTPISDRNIDVSYRARHNHYWLGSLAYEKTLIAETFIERTKHYKLNLDISLLESARVYGKSWLDLLNQSRAVLGTESGASIWDFDTSIEVKTKHYLKEHKSASFEEVYQHVLKPYDGNIVYSAISPRVFEAAATKTPMVMFPGYYSGVCKPNEHYILLEKDFSNLDDVLEKLKDTAYLQELANHTYDDLIMSDKYSQHQFSSLIEREILQLMTAKAPFMSSSMLAIQFNNHQSRYRQLNIIRRITTEFSFIVEKFWSLLTDPSDSFSDRVSMIFKGLKRYMTYIFARLTRNGCK